MSCVSIFQIAVETGVSSQGQVCVGCLYKDVGIMPGEDSRETVGYTMEDMIWLVVVFPAYVCVTLGANGKRMPI
jgi:hypothetical protein